jgi:hypothetical protein
MAAFVDHQSEAAGASMGLPRFHATLKASASFSATMAEITLADLTFGFWQKWLERYVLDWEIPNALIHGFATDRVSKRDQAFWEGKFSFTHPKQAPIDPLKAAKANTEKLNNNTITLRDILGPDWAETVKQRKDEVAAAPAKAAKGAMSEAVEDAVREIILDLIEQHTQGED